MRSYVSERRTLQNTASTRKLKWKIKTQSKYAARIADGMGGHWFGSATHLRWSHPVEWFNLICWQTNRQRPAPATADHSFPCEFLDALSLLCAPGHWTRLVIIETSRPLFEKSFRVRCAMAIALRNDNQIQNELQIMCCIRMSFLIWNSTIFCHFVGTFRSTIQRSCLIMSNQNEKYEFYENGKLWKMQLVNICFIVMMQVCSIHKARE